MEMSNSISLEHEPYSNPLRVLILGIIEVEGKASWTKIVNDLDSLTGKKSNPNSISFHLARLVDAKSVEKKEQYYTASVRPEQIGGEFVEFVQQLTKAMKK